MSSGECVAHVRNFVYFSMVQCSDLESKFSTPCRDSNELSDKDIRSSEPTDNLRDLCTLLCSAILQHGDCMPGYSSGKVKVSCFFSISFPTSSVVLP